MVKKQPKVIDPPRFPKIINTYEGVAQDMFKATIGQIIKEITDKMISLKS